MNDKPWYDKNNGASDRRIELLLGDLLPQIAELLEAYDAKCEEFERLQQNLIKSEELLATHEERMQQFKSYNRHLWEAFMREKKWVKEELKNE